MSDAKIETSIDLLKRQSRDAKEWADAFCNETHPDGLDNGLIHAWFANAMMAMYDSIFNNEIKKLEQALIILSKANYFYADEFNWDNINNDSDYSKIVDDDLFCIPESPFCHAVNIGGKKARLAQKKVKEILGWK